MSMVKVPSPSSLTKPAVVPVVLNKLVSSVDDSWNLPSISTVTVPESC